MMLLGESTRSLGQAGRSPTWPGLAAFGASRFDPSRLDQVISEKPGMTAMELIHGSADHTLCQMAELSMLKTFAKQALSSRRTSLALRSWPRQINRKDTMNRDLPPALLWRHSRCLDNAAAEAKGEQWGQAFIFESPWSPQPALRSR